MIKKIAPAIFIFIFTLAFISIMVTIVFSMIEGMDDFTPPWFMFVPIILIFILVIGVILYSVISGIRGTRKNSKTVFGSGDGYTAQHPMNYEKKASLNYCRYCGANLGTSDPAVCPECKNKLKNDFYH